MTRGFPLNPDPRRPDQLRELTADAGDSGHDRRMTRTHALVYGMIGAGILLVVLATLVRML